MYNTGLVQMQRRKVLGSLKTRIKGTYTSKEVFEGVKEVFLEGMMLELRFERRLGIY